MKQNESEVKVEAGDRKNGLRLELATGQANSHSLTTLTTILALDGIALLFFIRNTQRTRKREKSEDSIQRIRCNARFETTQNGPANQNTEGRCGNGRDREPGRGY